jgi:hypothetical protein
VVFSDTCALLIVIDEEHPGGRCPDVTPRW